MYVVSLFTPPKPPLGPASSSTSRSDGRSQQRSRSQFIARPQSLRGALIYFLSANYIPVSTEHILFTAYSVERALSVSFRASGGLPVSFRV